MTSFDESMGTTATGGTIFVGRRVHKTADGANYFLVRTTIIKIMSVIERSNIGRAEFTRACLEGGDLSVIKDFFRDHKPHFRLSLTEALDIACEMGSVHAVQWIMEESGKVPHPLTIKLLKDGFLKSCREGHLEVVKYMATRFECIFNMSSNCKDDENDTRSGWPIHRGEPMRYTIPLHGACKSGNLLLVQWLVQQLKEKNWCYVSNRQNGEGYLPVVTALQHNHFHIAEWLAGACWFDSWSFLHWVCSGDGDKPDFEDRRYRKMVRDAFIRKRWIDILHLSCCNSKDAKLTEFLIHECHVDPNITHVDNKFGATPLIASCNQKNFEMALCLIQNGADVNYKTYDGLTPLIAACTNGNSEMVQFLVEHGANVNQEDYKNGVTPIFYACKHSHLPVVNLMLKLGADVTVESDYGKTLLFYAHKAFKKTRDLERTLDIIKTLVEHGADINHYDDNGRTPLCDAAFRSLDLVKYYLSLPTIDLVRKNQYGRTLREWAESEGGLYSLITNELAESEVGLYSFIALVKARETRLPKLLGFLTERGWWSDDRFRKRDKSVGGLTSSPA